jgi:hypothetical protein
MYRLKIKNMEFTGSERVLFKFAYDFAINVQKLTEAEAREAGRNKVLSKRALGRRRDIIKY